MNNLKQAWIESGYEIFATEGPRGLKVEVLARRVNKSKSSFYHHFADLEIFIEFLLQYHLERAAIITQQEKDCKTVIPELLQLLVEVKEDLLFNRQLRIHRDNPAFRRCFEQSSQEVGEAILDIWAEALGLGENFYLAELVLKLSLENFYLQITPETLTYEWLEAYIRELQHMVRTFQNNERKRIDSVR